MINHTRHMRPHIGLRRLLGILFCLSAVAFPALRGFCADATYDKINREFLAVSKELENTEGFLKLEEKSLVETEGQYKVMLLNQSQLLEKYKIAKQSFPNEPDKWKHAERSYISYSEHVAKYKKNVDRLQGSVKFQKEKIVILKAKSLELSNALMKLRQLQYKKAKKP